LKEIPSRPQPRDVPAPAVQRLPNIAAIVLAAGRSTRMGDHNKLLLPLHGVPLISRTVTAVRGCPATAIIVVTGHDAQSVTKALDGQNVTFVHNPRYGDGMSTSLRAGIAALPSGTDGILVCLGDMPAIRADTIAKLIEAYDPVENKSIVVPTFQGKRGHPVLFAHFYRDEMLQAEGDGGARALLSAHSDSVYEVETSDAGVLADADTPAAFAALEAEFKS
jgi:molybdenum cofactor cytidylyltransferase